MSMKQSKVKASAIKDISEINKIPDYDSVFRDSNEKKSVGVNILKGMFKKYYGNIFLSSIFYLIKQSPVWIITIITSDVINIVTAWDGDASVRKLVIDAIILFVSIVQNILTHTIFAEYSNKVIRNMSAGLKATVVRKLQRLSITYHKEIESGRLQSKFLRDTENVETLLRYIITSFIPTILGFFVSVGIALYKSPIVTLFFVVVIPANVMLTRAFRKPIRKGNSEFRREFENMSAKVTQMLEMLQITKAHGLEDLEIKQFEDEVTVLTKKGLSVDRTNAYFGSTSWVVSQLFSATCVFFTCIMIINGVPGFDPGSIVLYQSLFSTINGEVQAMLNSLPQFAQGMESVRSLAEIMSSEDIENNKDKLKLSDIDGNVEFENVYYKFPDGEDYMIKDFNLKVKKGECIAFVGSSGSGKSTIMNMIIGFLKPTKGRLLIDGESIDNLNLSEYRHHISVVPQNSILFSGSIRDNITYGLRRYSEKDLLDAVEMANINEFLVDMPDGLDTNVGEHGGKLSGGQKQRITIARALIRNPKILILDEATSALDNISEYHVQQAINRVIKQHTTFIVAHRLSTIRNADRIVVMDSGKIVETGTYDELMEKKGKFYELKNLNEIASKKIEEE